jgi:hypothetical protein
MDNFDEGEQEQLSSHTWQYSTKQQIKCHTPLKIKYEWKPQPIQDSWTE